MSLFETAFRALKTLSTVPPRPDAAKSSPEGAASQSSGATQQFTRKIDVSAGIPHYNKGMILERRGERANAMDAYLEAVRAVPDYFDAHANLARLLCQEERWEDALHHGNAALRLQPNSPRVHNNCAAALYHKGKTREAVKHFTAALRLASDDLEVFSNLSQIRKHHPEIDKLEEGIEAKLLCVQLADKHCTAGFLMLKDGKVAEAIQSWRLALRFDPEWADLFNNLAWILATHPDDKIRNGTEAVELALRAVKLSENKVPRFGATLAAAYAECKRFAEARGALEKIIPIVKTKGPLDLAEAIPLHLKSYGECRPWREPLNRLRPVPRS
jgi:tetratricopeptide (TPR) repeat protein